MLQIRKTLTILLLSLSLLLAVTPAYYADKFLFSLDQNEEVLTTEQCESLNTPYPQLNKLINKFNVIKIEPWLPNAKATDHDGDVYLNRIYRLTTQQNIEAPLNFISEIKNSSTKIRGTEREAIMLINAIPNDPMIGNQWYLYKAQVREAWTLWDLEGGEIPGDRNIVVAVVDDGVEYTHPDLWKNIWINQDEIPAEYIVLFDADGDGFVTAEEAVNAIGDINGNGLANLKDIISSGSFLTDGADNDADGYIDNIIGWDTNESSSSSDDDKDPMVTNNSHGTHVAGLAGATSNNNTGIASAAYSISIMPVKATGDETELNINTGWDGILYAAQAGADIINCSWGGPGYSSYSQNLINTAYNTYGSLIVAAAGNGDDSGGPSDVPHYPSGYDNVVSVTAVSSTDRFSWANYGAADPANNFYGVDMSAPGESMLSTYLTKSNSYAYLMGTSMASPFVASCFALLKSVYPDSSNDWLVNRMLDNTDPIDHLNPGYEGQLGSGRVNIFKALVYDKWPKLSLINQVETITEGDADSILNPGEKINLLIEVKNDTGWAEASNLMGILRSTIPGINIIDSIGSWS
ncbi:MAG: S8 family serine peptidase, partial [Candidatus Marinimicrobia bacterium]|nr:S8 family serine peptidase [Candidatus Neomarinimicrobiota bacterium]